MRFCRSAGGGTKGRFRSRSLSARSFSKTTRASGDACSACASRFASAGESSPSIAAVISCSRSSVIIAVNSPGTETAHGVWVRRSPRTLVVPLQQVSQIQSGPVQAASDRPDRHPKNLRDLLVLHPLDVLEYE